MNLARTILVLLVALAFGLAGYQIGVSQNVAVQIPAGTAAVPPYYWYGPHMFGFGFLGFLFPLIFFFLFIGLIFSAMRAAAGGGRGWGAYGHEARRARFEEMHRELHGEKPSAGGSSTST